MTKLNGNQAFKRQKKQNNQKNNGYDNTRRNIKQKQKVKSKTNQLLSHATNNRVSRNQSSRNKQFFLIQQKLNKINQNCNTLCCKLQNDNYQINNKNDILSPTRDGLFKLTFKNSKKSLISFLNSIMKSLQTQYNLDPISDVDSIQAQYTVNNSPKLFVDIFCTDNQNRHIIVEMQRVKQTYIDTRVQLYRAAEMVKQYEKLLSGQNNNNQGDTKLTPKQIYEQIHQTYAVVIMNFTSEEYTSLINNQVTFLQDPFSESPNKLCAVGTTFISLKKWQYYNNNDIKLSDLQSDLDKWMFFFTRIHNLSKNDLLELSQSHDETIRNIAINYINSSDIYLENLNNGTEAYQKLLHDLTYNDQLQEKDQEIQEKDQEIQKKNQEIQRKDQEIQEQQQQLLTKDQEIYQLIQLLNKTNQRDSSQIQSRK